MPIRAVADTHAIIWYIYNDSRLSTIAKTMMDEIDEDGDQIAISTITLAEIVYLIERGRVDNLTYERVTQAIERADASLVEIPFNKEIVDMMQKIPSNQVPELPDRIISATAFQLGVPVISKDHKIQASIVTTIW